MLTSRFAQVRILLRPEDSKIIDWKTQTWISDSHPEHGRIARIILVLRIFNLADVAQAFFTALTSEKRITDDVSPKSQSLWRDALHQNITEYLVEDLAEDNESTQSSDADSLFEEKEPLSSQQQELLERLIKEGTKKFGSKKRSRDEEAGNDKEPPSKRQKNEPGKPFPLISFNPCAGTMHFPSIAYESRTLSFGYVD